jgi:two-component system, OmpR family, response regulator RegX3
VSKVLVVEDEPAVRDALGYALRGEGFDVDVAGDGEAGLQAAQGGDYDVLVLDLMLPKISGTEVCRRLRAESAVPIIMLTAKGAELDRVLGLEIGADDYVTKPFSMAELIGRIRAILRRRELDRSRGESRLRIGSLELNPMRHEARVDGDPRRLTP